MFIVDQKSRDTILGHFPLAAPMESPAIRLKPPLGHSEILTEFRKVYRPTGSYWGAEPLPSKEEAEAWRLWMREVFMPLNLEMEALILKHSDLLAEAEMPKILLDLSAHIAGYKPVLKSWERGDVSRNVSLINFPEGLAKYAGDNYRRLKAKQAMLPGELDRK